MNKEIKKLHKKLLRIDKKLSKLTDTYELFIQKHNENTDDFCFSICWKTIAGQWSKIVKVDYNYIMPIADRLLITTDYYAEDHKNKWFAIDQFGKTTFGKNRLDSIKRVIIKTGGKQ